MRKLLKKLNIVQEVSNKNRSIALGRGHSIARRLNPYNPLSYIVFICGFLLAIIMYGVVGFKNEVDLSNPFKWN